MIIIQRKGSKFKENKSIKIHVLKKKKNVWKRYLEVSHALSLKIFPIPIAPILDNRIIYIEFKQPIIWGKEHL